MSMTAEEIKEIQQGLKEISEGKVVPLQELEDQLAICPEAHTPECLKHKAIFGSVGCTCQGKAPK